VISTTGVVFATATYFGDVSLLSFLAVFATILAVWLGRAIARRMDALVFLIVCHEGTSLSGKLSVNPKTNEYSGQATS
jgi:hypothetical protein